MSQLRAMSGRGEALASFDEYAVVDDDEDEEEEGHPSGARGKGLLQARGRTGSLTLSSSAASFFLAYPASPRSSRALQYTYCK